MNSSESCFILNVKYRPTKVVKVPIVQSKVRRLRRDAIKESKRDLPTGVPSLCRRPECGLAYD